MEYTVYLYALSSWYFLLLKGMCCDWCYLSPSQNTWKFDKSHDGHLLRVWMKSFENIVSISDLIRIHLTGVAYFQIRNNKDNLLALHRGSFAFNYNHKCTQANQTEMNQLCQPISSQLFSKQVTRVQLWVTAVMQLNTSILPKNIPPQGTHIFANHTKRKGNRLVIYKQILK